MIHYLPHHAGILQDEETTKVSVVCDASAQSDGPSLNGCLHNGLKFNKRVVAILLIFLSYPVAFVANIEEAFLMISLNPKNHDVLSFLWVKDPFSSRPEMRFTQLVFGVSTSPFCSMLPLNITLSMEQPYDITHPALV